MVGAHAFEIDRHWMDEVVEVCTQHISLSNANQIGR